MVASWLIAVIYVSIFISFFVLSFFVLAFIAAKKRKAPQLEDHELPMATVIIPAWNEEKSVERTLNSILASDYPDFEVIFIDDGSTDKTYEIAKRFEKHPQVSVFTKKNGGKSSALNFGIEKAKGEIIFTMDADTRVDKGSMKIMARYFKNENVVSVTPAMLVDNPKTILDRVQSIEYLLGIFLRTVFAQLNAIYIAPGAFTVYKKWFFKKHGGYDENTIAEDLEMALRIQSFGYKTENAPTANIYTTPPVKFKEITIQRIRWYTGLVKNFHKYRHMASSRFGDLGLIVLPIGWITITFSIFILMASIITSSIVLVNYLDFLWKIGFDVSKLFSYTLFGVELWFFKIISNPLVIFTTISLLATIWFMHYAESQVGEIKNLNRNLFAFFLLFGPLFSYWWIKSFYKVIFKKKVTWR